MNPYERELCNLFLKAIIDGMNNKKQNQPPKVHKQSEMPMKYREMPSVEYIEVDEQGNFIKRPGSEPTIISMHAEIPPEYKHDWDKEPKGMHDFIKDFEVGFDPATGTDTSTFSTGRMKQSVRDYSQPPKFDDIPRSRCHWEFIDELFEPIEYIITPPDNVEDLEKYRKYVQDQIMNGFVIPSDQYKEIKRKHNNGKR